MENKGYGGAPAVAISRGECHWRKMQAALASKLTARASGCSLLARRFKRPGGPETQSPFIPSFWGCETQGAVRGRRWDTVGCLDWTILQFWDRTSCLPWLCRFALTGCNMAWTKSKWDNDDSIFFFFVFILFSFFISVSQWTTTTTTKVRGKAHQFLVPWHSCFSKFFGFLCFRGLLVWCYFTVLKKGTKYQFKGKKTAIMPTNILFYCISVVFTCFCLKTNTWIYMYVCICII